MTDGYGAALRRIDMERLTEVITDVFGKTRVVLSETFQEFDL